MKRTTRLAVSCLALLVGLLVGHGVGTSIFPSHVGAQPPPSYCEDDSCTWSCSPWPNCAWTSACQDAPGSGEGCALDGADCSPYEC